MSIHVNEVLDYLDTHPVCQYAQGMDSLMEMLHEVYTMHNSIDSEKMRSLFGQLRPVLDMLPAKTADMLVSLVCDLCMEHEQLAFSQGVLVGMQLMTEVNRLP